MNETKHSRTNGRIKVVIKRNQMDFIVLLKHVIKNRVK